MHAIIGGALLRWRETRVRRQPLRLRPGGSTSDGRPAARASVPTAARGPDRRRSDDRRVEQRRVRASIGRGSDFFGPFAHQSTVGDQVFARALAGKPARMLGDPDTPHTVTYIEDFARALATLGEREEALGEAWHVPNAEAVTRLGSWRWPSRAAGPRAQVADGPTMGSRARRPVQPHHPGTSGSSTNPSARGWSKAAGSSGPSAGAPHRCPRRSGPPRRGSGSDRQPPDTTRTSRRARRAAGRLIPESVAGRHDETRAPCVRPRGAAGIAPASMPARGRSHAITEFEFHISPGVTSVPAPAEAGIDGTSSRMRDARTRSSATRVGLETASSISGMTPSRHRRISYRNSRKRPASLVATAPPTTTPRRCP